VRKSLISIAVGALKAAHFGPTLLVVSISFLIALSQFSAPEALQIAIAILAGQLVVGWSNDLIDFPLDREAKRIKKPLVSGSVNSKLLQRLIATALVATIILSYLSPLDLQGTLIHMLGILSATAYNFGLKATLFSPVPYLISFGALPWAIYLAAGESPPTWLALNFILFSIAFHFLNVLKDLQWDIDQGILGLPQILGRSKSIAIAIALAISGITNTLIAILP
jgi:4-hydroxybenzoate polyprenyltransferase